ncbi:hypothetical protein [Mycobacterium angelicum]|uniref:Uncharacterized protein n=1 Tax=Mycobacterium angelicum TaxID=470074 RepID=A0A1W9ZM35_MYCAN|nr:hypothetical protein [Mycobacterium angelicum]MCV7195773.1 hypothetical protein [Mycobacterium angelicum]ORA18477.1 hypothetical protein BST12_18595 [Mycobacterium angelicum]
MTFAIAEVLADGAGRITMVADTKVTVTHNEALTRQIYTESACLKIVIVDDDVVVAFAGDTPESALQHVTGLRGLSADEVLDSLRRYSADHDEELNVSKSFLIGKRAPDPQLWRITRGTVEDSRTLQRLWIGEPAAFRAFQHQYEHVLPGGPLERRLVHTMQIIVLSEDIPSVGGYATRVSGDATNPFRFHSDPAGSGPWMTEGFIVEQNGEQVLKMRVPPGGDPSELHRIGVPGRDATFGAMAYFMPEISAGLLWTHAEPWRKPIKISGVRTADELVLAGEKDYGQLLEA